MSSGLSCDFSWAASLRHQDPKVVAEDLNSAVSTFLKQQRSRPSSGANASANEKQHMSWFGIALRSACQRKKNAAVKGFVAAVANDRVVYAEGDQVVLEFRPDAAFAPSSAFETRLFSAGFEPACTEVAKGHHASILSIGWNKSFVAMACKSLFECERLCQDISKHYGMGEEEKDLCISWVHVDAEGGLVDVLAKVAGRKSSHVVSNLRVVEDSQRSPSTWLDPVLEVRLTSVQDVVQLVDRVQLEFPDAATDDFHRVITVSVVNHNVEPTQRKRSMSIGSSRGEIGEVTQLRPPRLQMIFASPAELKNINKLNIVLDAIENQHPVIPFHKSKLAILLRDAINDKEYFSAIGGIHCSPLSSAESVTAPDAFGDNQNIFVVDNADEAVSTLSIITRLQQICGGDDLVFPATPGARKKDFKADAGFFFPPNETAITPSRLQNGRRFSFDSNHGDVVKSERRCTTAPSKLLEVRSPPDTPESEEEEKQSSTDSILSSEQSSSFPSSPRKSFEQEEKFSMDKQTAESVHLAPPPLSTPPAAPPIDQIPSEEHFTPDLEEQVTLEGPRESDAIRRAVSCARAAIQKCSVECAIQKTKEQSCIFTYFIEHLDSPAANDLAGDMKRWANTVCSLLHSLQRRVKTLEEGQEFLNAENLALTKESEALHMELEKMDAHRSNVEREKVRLERTLGVENLRRSSLVSIGRGSIQHQLHESEYKILHVPEDFAESESIDSEESGSFEGGLADGSDASLQLIRLRIGLRRARQEIADFHMYRDVMETTIIRLQGEMNTLIQDKESALEEARKAESRSRKDKKSAVEQAKFVRELTDKLSETTFEASQKDSEMDLLREAATKAAAKSRRDRTDLDLSRKRVQSLESKVEALELQLKGIREEFEIKHSKDVTVLQRKLQNANHLVRVLLDEDPGLAQFAQIHLDQSVQNAKSSKSSSEKPASVVDFELTELMRSLKDSRVTVKKSGHSKRNSSAVEEGLAESSEEEEEEFASQKKAQLQKGGDQNKRKPSISRESFTQSLIQGLKARRQQRSYSVQEHGTHSKLTENKTEDQGNAEVIRSRSTSLPDRRPEPLDRRSTSNSGDIIFKTGNGGTPTRRRQSSFQQEQHIHANRDSSQAQHRLFKSSSRPQWGVGPGKRMLFERS